MGESRELGGKDGFHVESLLFCSVTLLSPINPKCHHSCLRGRGLAGTKSPSRLRKEPANPLFLQLWPLVLRVADFQTALDFLADLAARPYDVFTCLLVSSVSLGFFSAHFLVLKPWNTVGEMLETG